MFQHLIINQTDKITVDAFARVYLGMATSVSLSVSIRLKARHRGTAEANEAVHGDESWVEADKQCEMPLNVRCSEDE